jgi:hypothetical protein
MLSPVAVQKETKAKICEYRIKHEKKMKAHTQPKTQTSQQRL